MDLSLWLFVVFGVMALTGGALVILHRNPVYSALNLVLTLFALSALYVILGAYFIAAVQVVVYAGAIVVLFLFVIMLLNLGRQEELRENFDLKRIVGMIGGLVFLFFAGTIMWTAVETPKPPSPAFDEPQHTHAIGRLLFQNYLLPFEITSVILLAGLVGIVVLIRFHGRLKAGE